jgi:hypothetical protein
VVDVVDVLVVVVGNNDVGIKNSFLGDFGSQVSIQRLPSETTVIFVAKGLTVIVTPSNSSCLLNSYGDVNPKSSYKRKLGPNPPPKESILKNISMIVY